MRMLVTRARVVTAAALGGAAARGPEARAQDSAAALPTREDPRVVRVYTSDRVWNGVTTTRDGRVFVAYAQAEGPGVQVAELGPGGAPRPFPDAAWNADSASGADVSRRFVHVNALRITPGGAVSTLAADPRFVWVDAMWIDAAGDLWMPVPQLNRTPAVNGGRMAVEYPVAIYRLHVGAGPPTSDHP